MSFSSLFSQLSSSPPLLLGFYPIQLEYRAKFSCISVNRVRGLIMKIIANSGVIKISLERRVTVNTRARFLDGFQFVQTRSRTIRVRGRTERGEERPTDVESRRIAYACKYKEELGGTGERRRSH